LQKYLLVNILFLFLPFGPHLEASGCTLWAAAGTRVEGGGILVAKNRDMPPDHRQELRLVRPLRGFRYLGLFAVNSEEPGVKAGVNEKGLVIVDAAASCIPQGERERFPEVTQLNEKLLAACADVDAVLRRRLMFCAPAYYLLADRSKAVILEVSLEGKLSLKSIAQGILTHTNHFLDANFQDSNKRISWGSVVRLERIQHLLALRPQPLTLADFIDFSGDRHDGPDRSIWRTGSSPKKIRTLASWILLLPPNGVPTLYVKVANPGEPPITYRLQLDDAFWKKGYVRPETSSRFEG
jgi:isopenicillin-N N-acyltransferase-like protein